MAHAVASMSAVSATAAAVVGPRFGAKTIKVAGGARVSTLAQRTQARKVASIVAKAIIQEETAEVGANAGLYDQFAKLLVDYEFSYKVGDKIAGKCFHCDSKGAWVDIGAKAAALCPASEASLADVKNVRKLISFIFFLLSRVDKIKCKRLPLRSCFFFFPVAC